MIAALPMWRKGAQDLVKFGGRGVIFCKRERFAAGEVKNFPVAERVGDVKAEVAGLARAKKFSGAAKLKIGFGDFKSVRSANHGFEASFGVFRHVAWGDQDAV